LINLNIASAIFGIGGWQLTPLPPWLRAWRYISYRLCKRWLSISIRPANNYFWTKYSSARNM